MAEEILNHAGSDLHYVKTQILHRLPTADFRSAAADFLDHWQAKASKIGPEAVALAILTAANAEVAHQQETIEIVWTGPETAGTRFRYTEQAILEVLNSAANRLTVVSYAVYRIPRICESLVTAAHRGVSIHLIVETPHRQAVQREYDCLVALGAEVAAVASVFYWPPENRQMDFNGKIGILHVKCAVADGQRLFISSANLTDYAFTINMELGLLITGGKLPTKIERHFDDMILQGILVRV